MSELQAQAGNGLTSTMNPKSSVPGGDRFPIPSFLAGYLLFYFVITARLHVCMWYKRVTR
jgi:hypothetical protein